MDATLVKKSAAEVLAYLRTRPDGCTSKEAWQDLGTSRLAARINELRAAGYDIESEIIAVRSGERVAHVSRYRLAEAPRQLEWSL